MRLRKKHRLPGVGINIAPLIDVVLLLIIFFMVIAQFTRVEIEALELPEAQQGDSRGDPLDRQVVINLHKDGRIVIAGAQYSADGFGQLLQEKLTKYAASEITVLIRADRQTPWAKVRELMEVCAGRAITRVRVAVEEEVDE